MLRKFLVPANSSLKTLSKQKTNNLEDWKGRRARQINIYKLSTRQFTEDVSKFIDNQLIHSLSTL
jgi:hypothetical protein